MGKNRFLYKEELQIKMETKEQERAELHKTIWQIATDLRGSVDGWDFKQYVLGILFYRFISENLTNYINEDERRSGKKDFDYAKLSNKDAEFGRADTVKEKGFYILPSALFENVTKKARNDSNLNETLAKVFKNIEHSAKGTDSEDDLKGLFDDLDCAPTRHLSPPKIAYKTHYKSLLEIYSPNLNEV
jgi:type I restriction enzyme M protein